MLYMIQISVINWNGFQDGAEIDNTNNKLELSWAKLSLAGAMVFGLGIVEF